nr:MAG TPA: hypothetical protein [Caudoviricetes sp.]
MGGLRDKRGAVRPATFLKNNAELTGLSFIFKHSL